MWDIALGTPGAFYISGDGGGRDQITAPPCGDVTVDAACANRRGSRRGRVYVDGGVCLHGDDREGWTESASGIRSDAWSGGGRGCG